MDTKAIVREFYDTYQRGAYDQLPLAENITHASPLGEYRGRDQYMQNCTGFQATIEIKGLVAEGNSVCAHIEVNGAHMAEWITIEDGLVTSIRAFFDASGMR